MSSSKKSLQEINPKRVDVAALILMSAIFLIVGLTLPILTVRKLWNSNTYSILTGIQNLWDEKYFVLAVIVFVFSIIFPIAKTIMLSYVWFVRLEPERRTALVGWMEILGKWSMLDVFVSAILIVWVKLGVLASARAEMGIYFFAASVLLTMLVSSLQSALLKRP